MPKKLRKEGENKVIDSPPAPEILVKKFRDILAYEGEGANIIKRGLTYQINVHHQALIIGKGYK